MGMILHQIRVKVGEVPDLYRQEKGVRETVLMLASCLSTALVFRLPTVIGMVTYSFMQRWPTHPSLLTVPR